MKRAQLWGAAVCLVFFVSASVTPGCGGGPGQECATDEDCAQGACEIATCNKDDVCELKRKDTPECLECIAPADCDDGVACTFDICGDDGLCIHQFTMSCCENDADCDDGMGCTVDSCGDDHNCVFEAEDCCNTDGTCDPAEDCMCADCTSDPMCATDCNGDGTCDAGETCDCADCAALETCGAGCTEFTVDNAMSAGFIDILLPDIGGPGDDYLQVFGMLEPGTYEITAIVNLVTDCMGAQPCVQLNVNGTTFHSATSGTVEFTAVSPIEAIFSDIVFHPYTADMNNNLTIDLDGQCFYLKQGLIPTPP